MSKKVSQSNQMKDTTKIILHDKTYDYSYSTKLD